MIQEENLRWSVIERNDPSGERLLIAKFDLCADAELFAKAISGRMSTFSYFVTLDGIDGQTWQGGHQVK